MHFIDFTKLGMFRCSFYKQTVPTHDVIDHLQMMFYVALNF